MGAYVLLGWIITFFKFCLVAWFCRAVWILLASLCSISSSLLWLFGFGYLLQFDVMFYHKFPSFPLILLLLVYWCVPLLILRFCDGFFRQCGRAFLHVFVFYLLVLCFLVSVDPLARSVVLCFGRYLWLELCWPMIFILNLLFIMISITFRSYMRSFN